MPITDIVPHKDGGAWGWDDSANKWVPVDPTMLSGNPIANLARGAALGFENVNQGARELLLQSDPNVQQQGQVLKLQTQAAQNAAPWTTALGMGAPEMVAGGLAGLATGGTSIPMMLAGQAVAGGGVGFMKPGDMAERVQNAALGAVFAAGGAGLGAAAEKGIMAGLALGRGVTEGSVEATAQGVINGVARQQNAEARAALAASADEAGGAAGVSGAAPDQAGSVGAAATPGAQLDPEIALQGQLMDQSEGQAAQQMSRGTQEAIGARGEQLGFKPAWWAGSAKGSNARAMGAASEFSFTRDANEAARVSDNIQLVNRAAAKAVGAAESLDPVANTFKTMDLGAMGVARTWLDQAQDSLKGEMPGMDFGRFRKVVDSVERPTDIGHVGEAYRKWVDRTMEDLNKAGDHATMTGEQFINQIRGVGHQLADAKTDPASMDKFIEIQNKLYNLAEQATKQDVSKGVHGGDTSITGKGWAELRKQELMYSILRKGGAVDGNGNINPRTLIRLMANKPTAGGFGVHGPPIGSQQRDLWDLAQAALQEDTMVPPTGARLAGHLGKMARGMYSSQAAKAGVAGTVGVGALNSIWGR